MRFFIFFWDTVVEIMKYLTGRAGAATLMVLWGKIQTDSVWSRCWCFQKIRIEGCGRSVTARYTDQCDWSLFTVIYNNLRSFWQHIKGQSSEEMKKESNPPDSLIKTPDFVSCWVWRNFINFVKCCFWLNLNFWGLLVNSAFVTSSF